MPDRSCEHCDLLFNSSTNSHSLRPMMLDEPFLMFCCLAPWTLQLHCAPRVGDRKQWSNKQVLKTDLPYPVPFAFGIYTPPVYHAAAVWPVLIHCMEINTCVKMFLHLHSLGKTQCQKQSQQQKQQCEFYHPMVIELNTCIFVGNACIWKQKQTCTV